MGFLWVPWSLIEVCTDQLSYSMNSIAYRNTLRSTKNHQKVIIDKITVSDPSKLVRVDREAIPEGQDGESVETLIAFASCPCHQTS